MTMTTTAPPSHPTHQQAPSLTTPNPLPHLPTTAATSQPYDLTAPSRLVSTQSHHQQPTPLSMTITLPHTPPPMIDTSSITTLFQCHHHTLNYLEDNIQQLSQSMTTVHATMEHINHILQPMTKTRSINIDPIRNLKVLNRSLSPDQTTHPQQSSVTASSCGTWTPRVPPKPPHIPALNNHSLYGHSNNQSMDRTTLVATKWHPTTHCSIPTVPVREKHTIARMRYKPHPSPSFLTLLRRYHAHNYRPP